MCVEDVCVWRMCVCVEDVCVEEVSSMVEWCGVCGEWGVKCVESGTCKRGIGA